MSGGATVRTRGECSKMRPTRRDSSRRFWSKSWLEHLRQHERVTNADRVLQQQVQRFHLEGAPKVTHMIAAERD